MQHQGSGVLDQITVSPVNERLGGPASLAASGGQKLGPEDEKADSITREASSTTCKEACPACGICNQSQPLSTRIRRSILVRC